MSDLDSLLHEISCFAADPTSHSDTQMEVDNLPSDVAVSSGSKTTSSDELPGTSWNRPRIMVNKMPEDIREHFKKRTGKPATVSEVTAEARIVLDEFLKRSLSHNDKSPYQHAQQFTELGVIQERPRSTRRSESYIKAASEQSILDRVNAIEYSEPEKVAYSEPEPKVLPGDSSEPDYVDCHQLLGKAHSISSQSSYGVSITRSNTSRSRSPSEKLTLSVHPQPHVKSKSKGKIKHKELFDSESSSSTEDYELPDIEFLARKKKSFFRWASERLRQSFRRKRDTKTLIEPESPIDENKEVTSKKPVKKKKKNKEVCIKEELLITHKRTGSKKLDSLIPAEPSPGSAGAKSPLYQEINDGDTGSLLLGGEELERSSSEKRKKSPVPWKKDVIRVRRSLDEKGKDNKGLFENILRQIRKGSAKLKRKGSKEDPQRSKSADNLVIRPLSKEHQAVLRRYVEQTKEVQSTDYDSDHHTVRSFHEVTTHRVEMRALPDPEGPLGELLRNLPTPELPPGDMSRQGHHSLRRRMQLEGLVPSLPRGEGLGRRQGAYQGHPMHDIRHIDSPDVPIPFRKHDSSDYDEIDGASPPAEASGRPQNLLIPSNKPFAEKTESEKEDLYEKIAEQLAAIADHYNLGSPCSLKSSSSPTSHSAPSHSEAEEGAAASAPTPALRPAVSEQEKIEKQIGALLRHRGDVAAKDLPDVAPIVEELVRNASYGKFKQIVHESVGSDPGWQQVAMMFKLTQTAVGLAGMGTAAALQIKEMTLKYFEDRFAGWIVGQGGWESMVEHSDSELD